MTDFHKRVYLLFKKRHVSHFQKKISFAQITSSKILFFLYIKSEGIAISKLVSQLKLLPSLLELEDNDTIVIAPLGKIVRFFYLHKPTDAKSDYLFCFEARKNIPQVKYGKSHGKATDCTLYCW